MTGALANRQHCQEELRRLTNGDDFLTRFALQYAVECLDLEEVNNLVDGVAELAASADLPRRRLAIALVEERLRPSRLD